jgi:hypothetical protein
VLIAGSWVEAVSKNIFLFHAAFFGFFIWAASTNILRMPLASILFLRSTIKAVFDTPCQVCKIAFIPDLGLTQTCRLQDGTGAFTKIAQNHRICQTGKNSLY